MSHDTNANAMRCDATPTRESLLADCLAEIEETTATFAERLAVLRAEAQTYAPEPSSLAGA